MRRPSPAILGSIALHAGVVALAFVSWPEAEELKPTPSSVPVSIVSSEVVAAAPADNPSEELIEDDAATAPINQPDPVPPLPDPTPPTPPAPVTPRPPDKKAPTPAPTPRPVPARPTPAPPTKAAPPKKAPTPPRPAPRRDAPSLDLDALSGPTRPTPNRGRPSTGQQGAGRASQATGEQITAIFNQVYPNWILPCDIPGADQLRIQVDLTLSPDGRITRGPTLVSPQSSSVYRAAADGALRALRQTAPFDVPPGFPGGPYRPTFNTERACANR